MMSTEPRPPGSAVTTMLVSRRDIASKRSRLSLASLLILIATAQAQPAFNTDQQIKLYESWVSKDPANISSRTLLAGAYIQKTRETTDFDYLNRASKILDGVLAEKQDYEALRLRNIVELTLHHFSKAAEYARGMTVRWPGDVPSWGTLGDALLEMGQYDDARAAFEKMLELKPGLMSYNRLGFYHFITGDPERGIALMQQAVAAAAKYPENKAWCLVELGNMYFKTAHWDEAGHAYREALATFPASHTAYAGLASVKAAQGKFEDAIDNYKRAQSITPMVQYAGALHDLYMAAGNRAAAQQQADMVDIVAQLEGAANQKANRTLALIYANQDRNLNQSLELAKADFEVRQDVYTYDVLAWALYKNQRYEEARKASDQALKLNAPEALFFYHAGMIANSMGDTATAAKRLSQALDLNPGFDIKQASIARQTREALVGQASPSANPR